MREGLVWSTVAMAEVDSRVSLHDQDRIETRMLDLG